MTASRGISPSGIAATSPLIPKYAKAHPSAAPAIASTRLSIRSWRTSRRRPAPSDARTAISFSRAAARARSMFATLLHEISSSSATAAASV